MLSFSGSLRVFVAVEPCDMRNHSEHLIIPSSIRKDPINRSLSGRLLSVARNNQRP